MNRFHSYNFGFDFVVDDDRTALQVCLLTDWCDPDTLVDSLVDNDAMLIVLRQDFENVLAFDVRNFAHAFYMYSP